MSGNGGFYRLPLNNCISGSAVASQSRVLPKINTNGNTTENRICHDDSGMPVKAQTLDELHSLQKKKSVPTTPRKGSSGAAGNAFVEEDRQKLQLQSISASLVLLTRESGANVVKGDPAKKTSKTPKVSHQHHNFIPIISVSDSSLKFTHVLYNLSPGKLYEQAIKNEHGSFIAESGHWQPSRGLRQVGLRGIKGLSRMIPLLINFGGKRVS